MRSIRFCSFKKSLKGTWPERDKILSRLLYGTTLDFYQSVVVTIGKRDAEKAFERIVNLFASYEVLPKLEDKELLLGLPLRFHNFSPRLIIV